MLERGFAKLVGQPVLSDHKRVLDTRAVRFADHGLHFRLGFAVLERVAGYRAGNELARLRFAAGFGWQEDPARQAVLAGLDKVALATLNILADQIFEV